MTSSEKNKIYVDYYNMAKDWKKEFLLTAFRNLIGIDCDSARIKRNCIADILYARGVISPADFVPYCVVLGLDKVINYGI